MAVITCRGPFEGVMFGADGAGREGDGGEAVGPPGRPGVRCRASHMRVALCSSRAAVTTAWETDTPSEQTKSVLTLLTSIYAQIICYLYATWNMRVVRKMWWHDHVFIIYSHHTTYIEVTPYKHELEGFSSHNVYTTLGIYVSF